ncbi:UNVERIFIED_CONTAM: hypothetical protein Sangu_2785700 [Sesamum angustifolium]|uniref:Uncharacterized protein n=1 Tax=Sesamum angustifolium TaxID=2727405 RepID=A0AAW2IU17_9LAMI
MILFLVEKLKDLQAYFEKEETYVDVILQSLPPSFDQFIVDYNMNRLEKSLYELINILVQYEEMNEKFAPLVLVGDASTSKAKSKVAGREKRKKDEMSSIAASTSSAPVTPLNRGRERLMDSKNTRIGNLDPLVSKPSLKWRKATKAIL